MSADYTWDVFCTLDGFGSYNEDGDWGGFWGKQGPEFLDRRLEAYDALAADGAGRQHLPAVREVHGSAHRESCRTSTR